MAQSHAVVTTSQARRLITRLGRHWAHKFDVVQDDTVLTVPFSAEASATLHAHDDRLEISLDHAQAAELATLQGVLAEHLQRFSRDETLLFEWRS